MGRVNDRRFFYVIVRHIAVPGKEGTFADVIASTVPLVPGMGVLVDGRCDPEKIEDLFLNEHGVPIARLPAQRYRAEEFSDDAQVESQWRFHTDGWQQLYDGPANGACLDRYYRCGWDDIEGLPSPHVTVADGATMALQGVSGDEPTKKKTP